MLVENRYNIFCSPDYLNIKFRLERVCLCCVDDAREALTVWPFVVSRHSAILQLLFIYVFTVVTCTYVVYN